MLPLVMLFAILKIVFSLICLLENRDTEERSSINWKREKNTALNTKDLRRETKRVNMKMT